MNKNRLHGAFVAAGLTTIDVAKALHIDRVTLWRKMTGVSDFTREEILSLRKMLDLTADEADKIFFSE